MADLTTTVCIIGAGAGGCAAAIDLVNDDVDCILIEQQDTLGGTGVQAYVNQWPGAPFNTVFNQIYNNVASDKITQVADLDVTLLHKSHNPSAPKIYFSPAGMATGLEALLAGGSCTVLKNTTFVSASVSEREIQEIKIFDSVNGIRTIAADYFIDATGNIELARRAGCSFAFGSDIKADFGEDAAPDEKTYILNEATLCFKSKEGTQSVEDYSDVETDGFQVSVPGESGKWVNPIKGLGLTSTDMRQGLSALQALAETRAPQYMYRVSVIDTDWLGGQFVGWEVDTLAPMLGIRESFRLRGVKTLIQSDCETLVTRGNLEDHIGYADHPWDLHGEPDPESDVQLYGIPYGCLLPVEIDNMLVACRGFSASHIAASTCRIQKHMMQLGQAAGEAIKLSISSNLDVKHISVRNLQTNLNLADLQTRCLDLWETNL